MAATADVSALLEQLIAAVANADPKDIPRFATLKRRAEETVKAGAHGRVDQFAVANQLDGLQEKFQVLNRDELADALRTRLLELHEHRSSWAPEYLSLLLELADRPAQNSRLDRIAKPKPQEEAAPLTWSDLDAAGSAFCDEDIWDSVDYGDDSSDEDIASASLSNDTYHTRPTQTSVAPEEDLMIPDVELTYGDDEDLIASIQKAQYWSRDSHSEGAHEILVSWALTELEVIREAIFMLQGLPTSVFRRLDGKIEVDKDYSIAHLSTQTFYSVLRLLCSVGTQIDVLRLFVRTPQAIPYMQTCQRGLEGCLSRFDRFLSEEQGEYLSPTATTSVSLLQLFEGVGRESRLLLILSDLVSGLETASVDSSVHFLNRLYDATCLAQATGDDDGFTVLADLFFSCFETYARPIRSWLDKGELEDSVNHGFFVHHQPKNGDLRTLWHDWYTLEEPSKLSAVPIFIQPIMHKILIAGKSMVFLRHLNMGPKDEGRQSTSVTLEDVCRPDSFASYLPFSALLESALQKMVEQNYATTSALLRSKFDEQCGLWESLQALEHIYLCRDVSISGPIDSRIFDLLGRGKDAWSDRYLLTELAQSTFGSMPFIDPSRLIVRSTNVLDSDRGSGRSTNMLNAISFDYILPWPVANIIPKSAIHDYQRISRFLMQIRRAKHAIVKQRLQHSDLNDKIGDARNNTVSYAVRHNMLWFLNAIYSHMTDLVISAAIASLHNALSAAIDIDGLVEAHQKFMLSLKEQCLLSENFELLHQTIISILDLCVRFADVQSTRYGRDHSEFQTSWRAESRNQASGSRKAHRIDDEDDLTDEDEDHPESETAESFHESKYLETIKEIKGQFEQLIASVAVGLKGVGRIDGQLSWDMLAEKLEWRKAAGGHMMI
ncbi:putative gamma-tubulin complex component GCP5 [Aspergillus saccharolyticus JOP 1030-1]|uniref:Spindle pole body component n=1 Tax=Aspergillus saccharolyticus JOP 1030-1 TaxID=1450539 RepID=A0A319AQI1_9EURO|nr:gamma-tubulin complex component GCP5 [Aspergillus saccharolyticus JOP 1030-1]PYH48662.1 gamma-tubulin complex component GCP5 [Aspergillus saccharolyticus JOP 1030-1]